MKDLKPWKSILALIIMFVSIYFQWMWPWGVIFIFWTVRSLYSGETFLIDEIKRDEYPALYWLIITTWILLSLYMIWIDISKVIVNYS